ncbi:MAG: response regulator transcription factor [Bacteroidales bacterium]|nr:response regulator transcription factor [Bacteroidales bacterium]MCF8404051.1 response regulator transcription factor [Bacteroidales bacterium]
MKKITAVIVDDEPEARDIMENLLCDFSDIQVLAKVDSVNKAVKSIREFEPDLVFLDIDMPGKNGFDLVQKVKDYGLNPTIIFVTAYDQFAIEAIKNSAFDYLVKPVDIDDLITTIDRYKKERKSMASLDRIKTLIQALHEEKLKFSTRTGSIFISPSEIIWCQADGNYTDLYLIGEEKLTITKNIGRLELFLPKSKFTKINRSVIINKQFLSSINRKEKKCILRYNSKEVAFEIPTRYISLLEKS